METFGLRLKKRRKELKLTQKDVGKAVGVSSVSVTQWEKDETRPKGENLNKLVIFIRTTPEWLLYGKGNIERSTSNVTEGPEIRDSVPLISSVQAGEWSEIVDNFQPGDAEEWRETTSKVSSNAFALRVKGDSMLNPSGFPTIPPGAVVIVDPSVQPENGSIVVARLEVSTEATLKKLVIDGPNRYLMALNPDYSPIKINGNCRIVGVVKKVEMDL